LEKSLAKLESLPAGTQFWLLIEDWDEGLKLWNNLNRDQALKELEARGEKYGCKFHFCAFNNDFDLRWDGDAGAFYTDTGGQTTELLLETDSKRFPGISRLKSLNYEKVEVEKVEADGRIIALRFKRLIKEDKHDCDI